MTVRIEFFSIPRIRAGTEAVDVEAETLGEALREVGRLFPQFERTCLAGKQLKAGYIANVNGRRFVSAAETPLEAGDCVMILSADAGG